MQGPHGSSNASSRLQEDCGGGGLQERMKYILLGNKNGCRHQAVLTEMPDEAAAWKHADEEKCE